MATVSKWTPFGVALDITATGSSVKRISATKYTVEIKASWKTSWDGNKTNYGMKASSGGVDKTISSFGTSRSSGSATFTVEYSISGNGSATKTITVKFTNYNSDNDDKATKSVSFNVTVPAWTSYTVKYNANGGSGAPSSQTKWKDQTLTLSSTEPTRTGYSFLGWSISSSATTATYTAGGSYKSNASTTLYAVWEANTYQVTFNANGGTGAPATTTKTYNVALVLPSEIPERNNYTFLGWATSPTATTPAYKAGSSYTTNNTVTLYAVWELAYTKPNIDEFTVTRTDDGKNALVNFTWKCDRDVKSITITCTSSRNSVSKTVTATGKTGTVENLVVGNDALSVEVSYTVKVVVSDENGSNEKSVILLGSLFTIDYLNGGKGAAMGKPAELEGVFDIAFQTRLLGGLLYPILEPCDLNELRTPNIYAGRNVTDYTTYSCGSNPLPFTKGTFILEILSGGPNGQILQRITVCDKKCSQVFERCYCTSAWGDWTGGWIYPTIESEFAVYAANGVDSRPGCKKDGRLVEVRGTVKPTVDIAGNTDMHTIITVPEGYRPGSPVYTICQGSGNCVWLLRVGSDGTVALSRYRNGDTRTTAAAGAWLPFQVTYFAEK